LLEPGTRFQQPGTRLLEPGYPDSLVFYFLFMCNCTHLPPYSVSGMVSSRSLIPRPTVFHDLDFVINYWQNNENKTFLAAWIYV